MEPIFHSFISSSSVDGNPEEIHITDSYYRGDLWKLININYNSKTVKRCLVCFKPAGLKKIYFTHFCFLRKCSDSYEETKGNINAEIYIQVLGQHRLY